MGLVPHATVMNVILKKRYIIKSNVIELLASLSKSLKMHHYFVLYL